MTKNFEKEKREAENKAAEKREAQKGATEKGKVAPNCPVSKKCGGCSYIGLPYETSLQEKQKMAEKLLSSFGKVQPILGMADPCYYRNKVHHAFGYSKKTGVISGIYQADSHVIVERKNCLIEDRKAQEIIGTIRDLIRSFHLRTYDEDTGYGLMRHVLIRRGFKTGEIMVVLVTASPVFPGRNHFVKALLEAHPEITTVVQNINGEDTSLVLGKSSRTLYGPGFIKDRLLDCLFRISPASFYQINPVETEILYKTAIDFADLTGRETVLDAYSGIGTIGITAAKKVGQVVGVELNPEAVRDAILNAKENHLDNIRFFQGDAGDFLDQAVHNHQKADVIFMDPPRTGSTEKFIRSAAASGASRIVYISCGIDTLARDLKLFKTLGYQVRKIQPVDMFPFTEPVECVVLLSRL